MKQEHSKRGAAITFLVQEISSRSRIITVTREFFCIFVSALQFLDYLLLFGG